MAIEFSYARFGGSELRFFLGVHVGWHFEDRIHLINTDSVSGQLAPDVDLRWFCRIVWVDDFVVILPWN